MVQTDTSHVQGVRAVGAFEFAKGVLVLLAGFGLLSVAHSDFYVEDIAVNLLYTLHISPERHLSLIFLKAAARLDDVNALAVAIGAAAYSVVRFIEGYGLWKARVWAEWFAIVSGSIYIPLEIYEVVRRATLVRGVLLALNLALLAYLIYVRHDAMSKKHWVQIGQAEEAD
ncbi:MAG TPA: DUF2127 domain-containing protein [Terriglobales bacterium]|nr:DUF2127 domain-containing protein [Terriglobales bacterium]